MQQLIIFKHDFIGDCWAQLCQHLDIPFEATKATIYFTSVDFE